MFTFPKINFFLGIPKLIPEWKNLFSTKYLLNDTMSGMTVAFIAIPLSLAIALASDVPPGVGLITAIVAGIVCALFGGTTLAVSGPAAAMSVLIADIVEKFGLQSLILICALAGVMQLISGMLGFGKLGRYTPLPVIAGFTAGIGVIILIGQLPRAFGLMPPAESDIFSVLLHLKEYLHEINGTCIFLVILTLTIIYGLPKLLPRVPAILPAVIITSLVTFIFDLNNVPLIGSIPKSLPAPTLPEFTNISLQDLIINAFIIYLLASLETLLSCSAIDKMTKGEKHNSDQELIGQGMGNIAVSLFGGIPISGVIARSATNVRAGAKTRRSSIIHAFIILLAIFVVSQFIEKIPIAALAAVLFSVAISMINYKEFYNLWKTVKSEALIYAITFFTIIFVDLLAGVQAGIIAACLMLLSRSTKTHLNINFSSEDNIIRVSLVGALTFLSSGKISELQNKLSNLYKDNIILLDLSNIRNLDMSGASAIIEVFQYSRSNNIKFFIKGLPRRFEPVFKLCEGGDLIEEWHLISEHQLRNIMGKDAPASSYGRLVDGFQNYYRKRQHDDKRLFEFIRQQQDPHTLFVTCSDSRMVPSLITSADPGELFIIRNVGNYIPLFKDHSLHSEGAAIEFALNNLDITDIVVCGHANCGAIKACQELNTEGENNNLSYWIKKIKSQLSFTQTMELNDVAKLNVVNQINNLKSYPIVEEKLNNQSLKIHAWFYDLENHIIYEWNNKKMNFKSIVVESEMVLAES